MGTIPRCHSMTRHAGSKGEMSGFAFPSIRRQSSASLRYLMRVPGLRRSACHETVNDVIVLAAHGCRQPRAAAIYSGRLEEESMLRR
jgi:hypothetical protein